MQVKPPRNKKSWEHLWITSQALKNLFLSMLKTGALTFTKKTFSPFHIVFWLLKYDHTLFLPTEKNKDYSLLKKAHQLPHYYTIYGLELLPQATPSSIHFHFQCHCDLYKIHIYFFFKFLSVWKENLISHHFLLH